MKPGNLFLQGAKSRKMREIGLGRATLFRGLFCCIKVES